MLKVRKNTTEIPKKGGVISIEKQNLIGILGVRGAGKSVLLESILERYWDCGYTVLDLWGAPNMENAFWIFARENHKKRIPITILAPESLDLDYMQVLRYNDKFLTKRDLIKFVKVPNPTAKYESEQNEQIIEIISNTILNCRDERRILVFNPFMFPNEALMFRILEILLRSLFTIAHNYFHAIKPKDVGKGSYNELTLQEKTHHKMAFGIREFGEVVPARIKGDQSGESTRIKKALLKFVRLARHFNIDGVVDYQNASDAESAIRNQFNIWLIKKWTKELGGESFKPLFDRIDDKRGEILGKYGANKRGFFRANNWFPEVENLTYYWMYVKKDGVPPYLNATPELHIKHKEPRDNWEDLTGIELKHDQSKVNQTNAGSSSKMGKREEKAMMLEIDSLLLKYKNKRPNWTEILGSLAKMQEDGDISTKIDFKTAKPNTVRMKWARWKKKQESSD